MVCDVGACERPGSTQSQQEKNGGVVGGLYCLKLPVANIPGSNNCLNCLKDPTKQPSRIH
jgi:hypothetical protein